MLYWCKRRPRNSRYFELFPKFIDILFRTTKNFHLNCWKRSLVKNQNIFIYNFALGSENKNLSIYTNNNNNNMSSSILEPKEHLNYHQHVTFEGTEEITVKKFSDLNINNIDYLNMDVQGYELEVLKGFDNP